MIYNLGSINADYVYDVPHLPEVGETLAASAFSTGLGGKGANMSVAVARAGGKVRHIGAVGPDGDWAVERLARYGVDTTQIVRTDTPTGHAIITVDPSGENAIVIFPGANQKVPDAAIEVGLNAAEDGDILLLQNETNGQEEALRLAKPKGLKTVYAAAPFEEAAVARALPFTDILVLNEVEMAQLETSMKTSPGNLQVKSVIVTRGANGARFYDASTGWRPSDFPAPIVSAVDTTGAGDTFTGYLAAGLDAGLSLDAAIKRAVEAAALKVTRKGTADAIPSLNEVRAFFG